LARQKHKNKEIEEVLQYAEQNGWTIEVHNKSKSHAWGIMKCINNDSNCWNGIYCSTSIWSTPKNSTNHAKQLKRIVDKCIYKEEK
jgi:hypothetical protein